ncbi:phosphoglucosamine mutase [Thermobispora bispora]|uniref:Phosphoglucosamine mutase n=1 Tax=Thermobispora bispora (strain ATCC 19993 / DSM 43833 / CBS 139.67 / JCM 10125 / KCTC 9307 / NBRC 14880 / R51) TaxID=469371 RepID=D6Y553_THEBD|nr:phosphoglucosamine mutase [Thermobispora bispora]MBO2475623.1 phosphoglucosamine mutase [Actinomycetales bacterium]MDI9580616.1 phosphoglucosamine mutase [Thermobispora sp.]ADG87328.1 phosphoglucosamine mutase [Thermobispora bispora DSM 43833]MBX6169022.1 phosphoglucosamine mutase [Thermobispora bispora]QSI47274.1 phosphoglucosamine mutase [Thermobispora bispora]
MGRLFGTDGVRGVAGRDLTAELAMDLAVAAANVLGDAGELSAGSGRRGRPVAVVGRDSRASGEFLEAAVVAGLASSGVDVLRLGVLPTPAVAYLTSALGADLGVMLSASHNPAPDNGIKFFARGGFKLPDAVEDEIEARLGERRPRAVGAAVGRIREAYGEAERYVSHLLDSLPHRLDGLRIVVDCAHGAAHLVAPEALRRAGAQVETIGASPDGLNINDGVGSTHLETLQRAVVERGADLGVAYDGDADRCLAVTGGGEPVDGDQILAILALAMNAEGRLAKGTVVATVMSNLGLKIALERAGLKLVQTAVGDRYVLEAMQANGYNLGGEQSGHVIMLDHATTGDGLLTSLHLLARVAASGSSLTELAAVMTRLPQVLVNVRDVDKSKASAPELREAVAEAEAELGETGRVLLRPSGTEPIIRVMVEAGSQEHAESIAHRLAEVVRKVCG